MKRSIAVCAAVAVLAGCAPLVIKTSEVTLAGDGNYLVVAKPSDNTDWTDIELHALKSATVYCAAQDKQMHKVNVETHGTSGWGQQEYALTFRCVPPRP